MKPGSTPSKTMQPGAMVRAEAVGIVSNVMREGASIKSIFNQVLPNVPDPRDRALLEALCFHALRHYRRYEFVISQWLEKPLHPADRRLQNCLIIGLVQLDIMQLPAHAAVSATVDAARVLGMESKANLVNAILRKATRETLPVSEDMAVQYSLPMWLYAQWSQQWPEHLQELLQGSNTEAPLWLSADAKQRDAIVEEFKQKDIACSTVEFPPGAFYLDSALPVQQLPGYARGVWHVQDAAAQSCVFALDIQPGQRVLDACAAPGGKTIQILRHLHGQGTCVALDVSAARVRKLQQNIARCDAPHAPLQLIAANASRVDDWWHELPFDRILLDAPCSATGVIRRQPDAKWNRREQDIEKLINTQKTLLQSLWPTLVKGGRLLYSTCSVLQQENQHQIANFLQHNADAQLIPLDERFGFDTGYGHQRLSGQQQMDGFFYALIEKRNT